MTHIALQTPGRVWIPFLTSGWGGNLNIINYGINFMHDDDKTKNNILKIPWFHTAASHFYETEMTPLARVSSENWRQQTHSVFLVAVFPPIPCLTYWPNPISRKLPVRATSGVHLYIQSWGFGWQLNNKIYIMAWKRVYINRNLDNLFRNAY